MYRFLVGVATLLGITSVTQATSHSTAIAERSGMGARASVLYKANFKSRGLTGWTRYIEGTATPSSWHVTGQGVLVYDGPANGDAEAQAPFSVSHLTDFAVQAQIEAVGQPTSGFSGFGVVARNAQPAGFRTSSAASGVMGGFYFYPDTPELVWYPDEVGGAAPKLHSGYNTYRLEVHGSDYSLLINGQVIVRFPITSLNAGIHVGLWALSQKVRVKSFEVLRLSRAATLAPVPNIKPLALGQGDVPVGFLLAGRDDYFTLPAYAQVFNEPTSVEDGFVLAFDATYVLPTAPTTGIYTVYSGVVAYSAAESAHAAFSTYWTNLQSGTQRLQPEATNFASGDVSGVGGEAHWVSFDAPESYYGAVFNSTTVIVVFQRGPYRASAGASFVQGTVSHEAMLNQVTAFARTVDTRIQHAGAER